MSWRCAKQTAAQKAYQELTFMTEEEIREYCQLPDRPHLREIDAVRDVFRTLRSKANSAANTWTAKAAKAKIGRAYFVIDKLEKDLIDLGLSH